MRTTSGSRRIGLFVKHEYETTRVAGTRRAYDVHTISYRYHVLDRQGRELLAYHWHPVEVSPVTIPHLHLSSRLNPLEIGPDLEPIAVAAMHLPTGPVALAAVVWLLITELGVEPRRQDWTDVLERNRDLPWGQAGDVDANADSVDR